MSYELVYVFIQKRRVRVGKQVRAFGLNSIIFSKSRFFWQEWMNYPRFSLLNSHSSLLNSDYFISILSS